MSQVNKKLNAFAGELTAVQKSAFTLVELLVVIAIIVILIGIIAPSVGKALQRAKKADAAAYLGGVASACLQYKDDNGVFPGQDMTDDIGSGSGDLTGSQMLAVCLLAELTVDNIDTIDPANVKSNYISYKAGETTTNDIAGRNYTLTDRWKSADDTDTRALLYYPSRIGNDGTINGTDPAFEYSDNEDYTGSGNTGKFRIAIWDKRFGTTGTTSPTTTDKAYNSDTFILISPSIDRVYFTKDDVMNFKK